MVYCYYILQISMLESHLTYHITSSVYYGHLITNLWRSVSIHSAVNQFLLTNQCLAHKSYCLQVMREVVTRETINIIITYLIDLNLGFNFI